MAGRPARNQVPNDVWPALVAALQGIAQNNNQANQDPARAAASRVIEQFRNYAPPKYNGRDGALALEEWFEELERIFEHIECNDAQKVSCAVFQLVEEAGQWWKSHRNGLTEAERQGLTWARFKEMAMDKYMPRAYRNQKHREFLDFKQGNLSVTDYERKFIQLARFATRLVALEADKTDYFLNGLRPEIRGILAMQENANYGVAVKRAHDVEAALQIDKMPTGNGNFQGKRKWDNRNNGKGSFANKRGRTDSRQGNIAPNERPLCQQCNKHHYGKCLKNSGVCYNCHEPGHYSNKCPKNNGNGPRPGGNGSGSGGNARLFAFSQQEASEGSGNMSG